jgi:hypothetical protein
MWHARASNVWVTLDAAAGRFELTIRDDGAGFEPEAARSGMGIANMRNRAAEYDGAFELISLPGEGTVVRFAVPYERTSEDAAQHRHAAYAWGVLLVVLVAANMFFHRSPQTVGIAVIALIGFARQIGAYVRLRHSKEAAA